MADAVRLISIRKGYDPREFALVVFGGAGPLHGAELARELSIPAVIVPPNPGVTSALGCLLVDVRHDLSEMFSGEDPRQVEEAFQRLEQEARERLDAEGIPSERQRLTREIDMRYVGQWRALPIEVDGPVESLEPVIEAFHAEHEREHSYRRDETPVEIYQLNVRATGEARKAELPRHDRDGGRPEPRSTRDVVFERGGDPIAAPVYARADLGAGIAFEGPALIDQLDSTVLVPPGVSVEVDEWLNIHMEIPS
jgi:N-methylhydantoinase A